MYLSDTLCAHVPIFGQRVSLLQLLVLQVLQMLLPLIASAKENIF